MGGNRLRPPGKRSSLLIFIEFPSVAPVGIPFDAVGGEMQRLLRGKPFIVRHNSLDGFSDGKIFATFSFGNSVELRDPLRNLCMDRSTRLSRQDRHTVQYSQTRHSVRIGGRKH